MSTTEEHYRSFWVASWEWACQMAVERGDSIDPGLVADRSLLQYHERASRGFREHAEALLVDEQEAQWARSQAVREMPWEIKDMVARGETRVRCVKRWREIELVTLKDALAAVDALRKGG